MKNSYFRFLAMIATSIIAMFLMTYLNSWEWSHVFWSETRAYMVLYMGAVMAIIMLAFMLTHVHKQQNQPGHSRWRRHSFRGIPHIAAQPDHG